MKFNSRSQAGQDLFVYKLLVETGTAVTGTFLDVGANHPVDWSNTYELEKLGWTGCLFENEPNACNMLRALRTSPVLEGDVTKTDWRKFVLTRGASFDYLSLDVDYISHGVLLEMLVAGISVRVATIEHNDYNYPDGSGPSWATRALMYAKGYSLVAKDVTNNNAKFEDWWVNTQLVDVATANRFLSDGRDGLEIASW